MVTGESRGRKIYHNKTNFQLLDKWKFVQMKVRNLPSLNEGKGKHYIKYSRQRILRIIRGRKNHNIITYDGSVVSDILLLRCENAERGRVVLSYGFYFLPGLADIPSSIYLAEILSS